MTFPRGFSMNTDEIDSNESDESGNSLDENINQYVLREGSTDYHEVYPGVEMIQYDYVAERNNFRTTNLVESTAYLIKACLGAGLLGIHEAYMYGGLWTSLVTNILLGTVIAYTTYMVVRSAHVLYVRIRLPKLSYPELTEVAVATGPMKWLRRYSKIFRYTIDFLLFTEFCGTCCIFEIMIGETIKSVLESLSSYLEEKQLNIRFFILAISIPIILLCVIRNLKYLAILSLIADVFVVVCVLTTVYYSLAAAGNISDRPGWKSIQGVFKFSGICIFALDGVALALPIENNMKSPQYFNTVLSYATTIVVICVTMIGFFGYWGWGENCVTPITMHMPMEIGPIMLQFLLSLMLGITFAIHFWVPFRVVWYYAGKKLKRRRGFWERVYRVIHVLFITLLAVAFPDLIRLMDFIGNFLLAFIVFIFPAFIDSCVMWREQSNGMRIWNVSKNVVIAVFGITLCAGAFYATIPETL